MRQLGSANVERPKLMSPFEVPPGSWGLLQDLHQLHLKLHDVQVLLCAWPASNRRCLGSSLHSIPTARPYIGGVRLIIAFVQVPLLGSPPRCLAARRAAGQPAACTTRNPKSGGDESVRIQK